MKKPAINEVKRVSSLVLNHQIGHFLSENFLNILVVKNGSRQVKMVDF